MLLSEIVGVDRTYYGFDSFEGFPPPKEEDELTPITGERFWANPPETVLKTLQDGRIPEEVIRTRVKLVRGWFEDTVPKFEGKIALLHLDGDLYASYKVPLDTLYEKVCPGGVIMFDEYKDARWPGATKAIDEVFADKPETVQSHELCTWKYHVVKA